MPGQIKKKDLNIYKIQIQILMLDRKVSVPITPKI